MSTRLLFSICLTVICAAASAQEQSAIILRNINLIDGTGDSARPHVSLLLRGDSIAAVLPEGAPLPQAKVLDMNGKTVMPLLVNAHGHVGLLKGNSAAAANYTRENIERQLQRYLQYGVGAVLSLGTDQAPVFPLRNASQQGRVPGATLYTAGYGFGARNGVPPAAFGTAVLRPQTPQQAQADMQRLAALKPDFVKIWVDDGGGTSPKMDPAVYTAIIKTAHAHHLRVAAHVYYLEDARRLVQAGVDVLAHSIRDREVDDALINEMKQKGVFYIPTLSLDEYGFIYAGQPEWINDPFFIRSLEPGVWDALASDGYRQQQQQDPGRAKKMAAFMTAMRNLHKLDSAGVKIAMGTDSGAQPVRAQGFSEHLELQLMTEAGMRPIDAITSATRNGAELLQAAGSFGTLRPGRKASFMVLDGNPLEDMKATRNIVAVWKNGRPLAQP